MHEVLVNRLGGLSLPRKSVVRLYDRPDMTLDVYRGRITTTIQVSIKIYILFKACEYIITTRFQIDYPEKNRTERKTSLCLISLRLCADGVREHIRYRQYQLDVMQLIQYKTGKKNSPLMIQRTQTDSQ